MYRVKMETGRFFPSGFFVSIWRAIERVCYTDFIFINAAFEILQREVEELSEILDLAAFLRGKCLQPAVLGKSGAQVYFVDTQYVWKYARRADVPQAQDWDSYVREARMYAAFREKEAGFMPDTLYIGWTPQEISLLLVRGQPLQKTALDVRLLDRVMDLLVKIHHFPPPDFLEKPRGFIPPGGEEIGAWLEGWESVLAEHPGMFSHRAARFVAAHYTQVNREMENRPIGLVHGDFHIENLLNLPDGQVAACDWQSAGLGDPAGDLSFLRSRLCADGIKIDEAALIRAYCAAAVRAGYSCDTQAVARSIALANVNTSFEFWHRYLHNTDAGRVANVFEKMVEDMRRLMA